MDIFNFLHLADEKLRDLANSLIANKQKRKLCCSTKARTIL